MRRELSGAAQCGVRRQEGGEEDGFVVCLGVADKRVPICLSQALAHPKVMPNARAGLCEEGGPALGGTLAAELEHRSRDRLGEPGGAATEVEQCGAHHWRSLRAL